MKAEPFIKPEPENGDGDSTWWKNLPMFQPAKSEDVVQKQHVIDVNLATIPRKELVPEKPSHEAVNFLSHVPMDEMRKVAHARPAGRNPTTRAMKQNRSTRYQYRAYHRPFYRPVHRRHFKWLRAYPTPRPFFNGFCFNCGKKGHRQEICRHNILVPEVDQKYWLARPGVVGAINRLVGANMFRKDERHNVFYFGDGTEQQVDGKGTVQIRAEVNKFRIVDIFDAEGNLFDSFWDTLTPVQKL